MSKKKKNKMNKEEQNKELDTGIKEGGEMEGESIEVATVTFKFPLTRDEAYQVIHRPRGKIAKGLKKFIHGVLIKASEKFLESNPDEDVKECKLTEEKD